MKLTFLGTGAGDFLDCEDESSEAANVPAGPPARGTQSAPFELDPAGAGYPHRFL